jgi:hypothetical protein
VVLPRLGPPRVRAPAPQISHPHRASPRISHPHRAPPPLLRQSPGPVATDLDTDGGVGGACRGGAAEAEEPHSGGGRKLEVHDGQKLEVVEHVVPKPRPGSPLSMERGSSAPDRRAGPRSASPTARSRVDWVPLCPDRRPRSASASASVLWRPRSPWKAKPRVD